MNAASRQSQGFTLTENLMAMSLIVTVAIPLTAMLGMATNARNSADHRRESAYLARQIAAELAHSTAELGAARTEWYPLIAVAPATGQADDWPYLTDFPADLDGHSVCIAYDGVFQPAGVVSLWQYENGTEDPSSPDTPMEPLFLVRIDFHKVAGSGTPAAVLRANVSVGTPANVPVHGRRVESFTTRIHKPDGIN